MSILSNTTEAGAAPALRPIMAKREKPSLPARKPKVPPPHPGVGIGHDIEDVGLSAREAARFMGVNHQTLANLINGKSGITPEMAVRLQAFMGNGEEGAEFWLRLQAEYDLWYVREKLKEEIKQVKPAPREPKSE